MAAVEGIQDQVADVKQKHVPQKLNIEQMENNVLCQLNGKEEEKSCTGREKCSPVDNCSGETKYENMADFSAIEDVEMVDTGDGSELPECKETLKDFEVTSSERNHIKIEEGESDKIPAKDSLVIEHCKDEDILSESTLQNGDHDTNINDSNINVNNTDDIQYKEDNEEKNDTVTNKQLPSSDNLKQENLLKKLGFDPVKKISLEDVCSLKEGKFNEPKKLNKVITDVKDKFQVEIDEINSNGSSRCSSPGNLVNGISSEKESSKKSKILEQKLLIASLKEDLRTEEAQLLLLRKIMQSQSRKNVSVPLHKAKENSNRHVNMPSLHPKSRYPTHGYSNVHQDGNVSSIQIAPKIVIGSKSSAIGSNLPRVVPSIVSASKSSTGSVVTSSTDAARVTYAQIQGSVSSAMITQPGHRYYIQVGSQLVPAAPPTCVNQPVYAMPIYSSATSSTAKPKMTTSSNSSVACKSAIQPVNSIETQASKHSAAKAALRRQLEQTLLQIPPPRPPAADWHAIPNVNSMDFMMLVGLDEIVDMILECDGKPTLKGVLTDMLPENPIICDQCGMDFSPLWKNRGSEKLSGVLCEKCSLMNTKKELKAEHTSRLKSAFLKALKQEQEIEEKIKAGEDVYIGSPPLQEKDVSVGTLSHHKPQGHVHSVHQPYKHQKKGNDHHHQVVHHHHHGVVQHYPHHTSLVHQLHQQHIQQQQVDYDPGSTNSRRSARWHPYVPSHHHGSNHVHGIQHHRTYSGSSGRSDGRHEYYVVHHPQHSTASRWGH